MHFCPFPWLQASRGLPPVVATEHNELPQSLDFGSCFTQAAWRQADLMFSATRFDAIGSVAKCPN
jgi:hypothetical protein